ncbi:MAG: HAMP domain-containing histidine kinase [Saprospiraceae bacterium]|nr:HAMP domain-containing histidine kinase [Saprospiraceae bacterium]
MLKSALTIRQRLPLFISISALLILLLEGYFIYIYSVRFCEQEFRERIQERLAAADSAISVDPTHPFAAIQALPPAGLPDEQIVYVTGHDINLLPGNMDTSQLDRCTYCFAQVGLRDYGVLHDSITHHTLMVSAVDRYGMSKIRNLRSGIMAGILLGVLLLTIVSWFWVKKMLQPIADKIKKARSIGARSLNLRLNVKNNYDELGQLALTFNEMLDRIEGGFRTQQQFIRNASHEMLTPLTAITAEADLALQQSRSKENYQHALENIRQRAQNLNELVAQLLLMAKVDSGGNHMDRPCAADEILLQVLKNLQNKYPEAGHMLQLQIEAMEAAEFVVMCDPAILQAAYHNLLDNALKYGNEKPVSVRLFLENKSVGIEVKDQGDGIAAEDMEHLFKPFYRSKKQQQTPGVGIGLSLVKSIAEKYKGNISIHSEPGQGVTARFLLPVSES